MALAIVTEMSKGWAAVPREPEIRIAVAVAIAMDCLEKMSVTLTFARMGCLAARTAAHPSAVVGMAWAANILSLL